MDITCRREFILASALEKRNHLFRRSNGNAGILPGMTLLFLRVMSFRISLLLCGSLFLNGTVNAQIFKGGKLYDSKLMLVKTGPYIGLEKGKYLNFNFGVERQYQQLKLIKPQTHSVNLQFDYNFKQNVMGAQVGYWFKTGRLNLTYGARISWRTDFGVHRYAFSPNVGYKFLQAHFQLGVHLMGKSDHFQNTNTFYASLRYVFINNRDFKRKK